MSHEVTEGNAVADATVLHSGGRPVADVVIRVDQSMPNSDGPPTDYEVTVWGKPAETFALSALSGARIVAAGELSSEEYTASDGTTRLRMRITADHHGISSRYAPAVNTRRNGGR